MTEWNVVIDNGSSMLKAGFSHEAAPRVMYPMIVGRPRQKGGGKPFYVGNECQAKRGLLTIKDPVEKGLIKNWDDMEAIWRHTLQGELRINPANHKVLLTTRPLNPKGSRERMAQVMFETFGVPAMGIMTNAILALYASGRTTGIVLDSGDGISHCVPVQDGYALNHAIIRLEYAGHDLNDYLQKALRNSGYDLPRPVIKHMKETIGYVSMDFDTEVAAEVEHQYSLPDGKSINVGNERFKCAEGLFNPSMLGKQGDGVHTTLFNSIEKCDLSIRPQMYNNIVIAGGSTRFANMPQRIEKEMKTLAGPNVAVQILGFGNRQYSVFQGGAILTSLPTYDWVTKQEYDDTGPAIVHRKCY